MRVLLVGAGGFGTAIARIAARRGFAELMNADPRFVMPLFRAVFQTNAHYLDMAMSLSHPHQDAPYSKTGVKLGDDQFALASEWEASGSSALPRPA